MESVNWQYAAITSEGQPLEIDGIDIWKENWESSKLEGFDAKHPSHPKQTHTLRPYKICAQGKTIHIAVSEVSANVYLFYKLQQTT